MQTPPAGAPANGLEAWLWPIATGVVGLGASLTMLPLHSVFTDANWFINGLFCALPYWAVVGLLRRRGNAPWFPFAGLLASALTVLWVFVPDHLAFGVLPTGASFHDFGALVQLAGDQVRSEHAPVSSTHALRLLTTIAFVIVVVLADLLAITLRHPLLAGAPLLEVLAVSAAIASKPTNPVWFAFSAAGFLLILLTGTRLQDREWGPSVDGSAGRLGGARRIAVSAIVAALLVPVILPAFSVNLLSRAAHRGGDGGPGGGDRVVLSDLASLRGSLERTTPVDLFSLTVFDRVNPFYVRTNVLDVFAKDGWRPSQSPTSSVLPLDGNDYPELPPMDSNSEAVVAGTTYHAQISIQALGGRQLPVLSTPVGIQGAPEGRWVPETGTAVLDSAMTGSTRYEQDVFQATPTAAQLRAAPAWVSSGSPSDNVLLALPTQPNEVSTLVNSLTGRLRNNYDKALAITDYFRAVDNGFQYSLEVPASDGQSAIVAFLKNKRGFCQQYAATAAVMMRLAGIPSRVVVGYNHVPVDGQGFVRVSTADAHAWVEAFFPGIGWTPFDPTPLSGTDAGRAIQLPWSPTPSAPPAQDRPGRDLPTPARVPSGSAVAQSSAAATTNPASGLPVARLAATALALAVLALVSTGPRLYRSRVRQRRFALAGSSGDPEPLWAELAATAQDQGALWPQTVTVGQVPDWLAKYGLDDRGRSSLLTVAHSVERRRYSASASSGLTQDAVTGLSETLRRWERRDTRPRGLVNRWLPASVRRKRASRQR